MRVFVVYDSVYGNTEKIAKVIGSSFGGETKVIRAAEMDPGGLQTGDVLIIGAPTYGGKATQPVRDFLDKLPETTVKGMKVAAFDTRYAGRMATMLGSGAGSIVKNLQAKGAVLVSPPEGFIVEGKKGPLKEGELERAASWAKSLVF